MPTDKIGGLVLEVKGDFCKQVHGILKQAGREHDYVEIGLESAYLLQPSAQRSRPVRGGVRHRHTLEQPVRQIEGAVLAAGIHRPAEVRDPPAPDLRRLHDARRCVPLHPRAVEDRAEHQQAHRAAEEPARSHHRVCARLPGALRAAAMDTVVCGEPGRVRPSVQTRTSIRTSQRRTSRFVSRRRTAMPGSRDAISCRPSTAGSTTAGVGSTIACARRSPKASSCSCRCSTTTRSVHDTFCPPRSAYAGDVKPGEPRPLPPLEELLETGSRARAELSRRA